MLIQGFLEKSAARLPDKTALVCGGQRYTYGQLDGWSNHLAQLLQGQGVRRGDRVAMYLNNSVEAVIGIFGILKAGAVIVALNRTTKPEKLLGIVQNCQAAAALVDRRAVGQGLGNRLFQECPSVGS